MKKILFTFTIVVFAIALFAQQVPRNKVVLEIGTGTWCVYCPGAAMGAEDLVANGCDVAVIEYHKTDSYTNSYSTARLAYYNMGGIPEADFDGVLEVVGGSPTQSMYSSYLPLYNQRIAINCDMTIEIYGENTGNNYEITVVVEQVASTTATDMTLQLVLTESEIPEVWQNQTMLHWVERLMAPDENGTSISFSSGDEQIITQTFTVDPTWVIANCELVAFVQDEATKEILQGTLVELDNLQPLEAEAAFSCNDTITCLNSTVDFYDNSGGSILTWSWTFEGGTPATSTVQNPTVTYNTLGDYDVTLTVTDDAVSNTLVKSDYISVVTTPVQATTPSGASTLCEASTGIEYTIDPVPSATTYLWRVLPAEAGSFNGNSIVGILDLESGYTGDIDIQARAENACGIGTWSPEAQVTVYNNPISYQLSGNGEYCEGTSGTEITLDGSEIDTDYELYVDDVASGQIIAGTGSAISFGDQINEGIYTCLGANNHCDLTMTGNIWVHEISMPEQALIPIGPADVCNTADDTEYTSSASGADTFIWVITPAEAGIITGTGEVAIVDWNETYSGIVQITAQGENDCGIGTVSDIFEVTSYETPTPVVSGNDFVCKNQTEIYSTPLNVSNTYTWGIAGGTIIAGAETNEITVTWGNSGSGFVNVTEETTFGCIGATEDYAVTIDECVGIEENKINEFRIFPNPSSDNTNIQFFTNDEYKIKIFVFNQIGNCVHNEVVYSISGNNIINIKTDKLSEGIYNVQLLVDEGKVIQRKFVKIK